VSQARDKNGMLGVGKKQKGKRKGGKETAAKFK